MDSNNSSSKISVCLFSDYNFLALNILENFLVKNCFVNVVTEKTEDWMRSTSHITKRSNFSIINKDDVSAETFDYYVFLGGFIKKEEAYKELIEFLNFKKHSDSKTLVILPFEIFDEKTNTGLVINDNTGVIYVGDLLGPRIDFESNLFITEQIKDVLYRREMCLNIGEIFYPLFAPDAAKTIAKWLFSFGPYGREVFLMGPQISGSNFWEENRKILPEVTIRYNEKGEARVVPRRYEIETLDNNLRLSLTETYKWLIKLDHNLEEVKAQKKVKNPKMKKAPDFIKLPLLISLIVFLLPVLTFIFSSGFLVLSYKSVLSGKNDQAENVALLAKTFYVIGKKYSQSLSFIPLLGSMYKETHYANLVGERVSDITVVSIPTLTTAGDFFVHILGNQIYDPNDYVEKMETNVDYLYNNLMLLQMESIDASKNQVGLAGVVLEKVDLVRAKDLLFQSKQIIANLPKALGNEGAKTYLILFQNNMELRPTGGFIGSFGLLTFDGGRMSDLTINDVYSADGQLNGHVEPPAAIRDYLGEANWWLRDSNWDPDFPTSAKRAEWFLDKELGQKVDGVVAVDLSLIKDFLEHTGPIFLPDYNLDITSENLYEKTQSEVENEFFPGTHKKASFLSALSRSLVAEIEQLKGQQKLLVLKTLLLNLETRHIQAFFHDEGMREPFYALNWDGTVLIPSCGDGCYADTIAIVEANVGVNKSNYFVSRKADLVTDIANNKISHTLSLSLENSANPALGLSGRYKTYIRLLIPAESEVLGVKSLLGQNTEDLPVEISEIKGRKEVGVLVEVIAGQSKKIEFFWQNNLPQNIVGYGLYIRKQAGIDKIPLSVKLTTVKRFLNQTPRFNLTREGSYLYNTNLVRDLFAHFSW